MNDVIIASSGLLEKYRCSASDIYECYDLFREGIVALIEEKDYQPQWDNFLLMLKKFRTSDIFKIKKLLLKNAESARAYHLECKIMVANGTLEQHFKEVEADFAIAFNRILNIPHPQRAFVPPPASEFLN